MTIKQILFSMFMFNAISNIVLPMKSHPNAIRFDKGVETHLNDSRHSNFWESVLNEHLNSNNYIDLIEITYENKEIKRGTIEELKKSNLLSSKFGRMWNPVGGIWDPINRNNAFFDPIKQAIYYGNVLEKDPSLKEILQLIEKAIEVTNKNLLQLNEKLVKLSCKKEEKQYKDLIKEIENTKQQLNVLYNTYNNL